MPDPVSMIFFPSGALTLDDAARVVSDGGLDVTDDGDAFTVQSGDGPPVHVRLSSGPEVQSQAAEIARGTPHAAEMSRCDARFEIAFDDPGALLDEANPLIEVQLALQEATGGYQFNSWNQQLSGPGGA